jgi:hypothetical protein
MTSSAMNKKMSTTRASSLEARHRPNSTLRLSPGIPQQTIIEVDTWSQRRHDTPLGTGMQGEVIERQILVIEGPRCSGKSTLAEIPLLERGYKILKYTPASKPKLSEIYHAAISLTNVSSSLERKRVAIIMEDIHLWSGFPFAELTKLLTLHKASVAKSIRASLLAEKKISDKPTKRRKRNPKADCKEKDIELDLEDSSDDDDDEWIKIENEKLRLMNLGVDADQEDESSSSAGGGDDDATTTTSSDKSKSKPTKSAKLNRYGLSGTYDAPLICPIIATLVPAYLDGEHRTKARRETMKSFVLQCKKVKLQGFAIDKLKLIVRNICAEEKIQMSMLEQASLIEFAGRDLKRIMEHLEFGGSVVIPLIDPKPSAVPIGTLGSGSDTAFDCVDQFLQNSGEVGLQQSFAAVERHNGLSNIVMGRYLDGVRNNTIGEVAGFLRAASDDDADFKLSSPDVREKIFVADVLSHNRGWRAPGWDEQKKMKLKSLGANMGSASRCYDRERRKEGSFTSLFQNLNLPSWMMTSSIEDKFQCLDVIPDICDVPLLTADEGKMIKSCAFKSEAKVSEETKEQKDKKLAEAKVVKAKEAKEAKVRSHKGKTKVKNF